MRAHAPSTRTPTAKAPALPLAWPTELSTAAVLTIVGSVGLILYFFNLGAAPFLDPSEGLHANIAQEMTARGDWLTPHMNGVRHFDKPPLLYWLMAGGFALLGPTEWAARLWSAVFAVAIGLLTAWLGTRLGSRRLGLIAGLLVLVNFELFVCGRLVKQDMLFIFLILLAFACFIAYYQDGRRAALLGGYAALGATVLATDILGVLGPIAVFLLFFVLTKERNVLARWWSWAGAGLFAAIALPWYVLMELQNPGFLWYTFIDKHVLNFLAQRYFPDEDVPLTALEFLAVSALGFLPWTLGLPFAFASTFSRPLGTKEDNLWFLLALWPTAVLLLFTVSDFKLPHYALPAFPHMALLVARVWDDAIAGRPRAPSLVWLLTPALAVVVLVGLLFLAGWLGALESVTPTLLAMADGTSRNMMQQGLDAPVIPDELLTPRLGMMAVAFWFAAIGLAVALAQRHARVGLSVLLAITTTLLLVTADAFVDFAKARTSAGVTATLEREMRSDDTIVHEGPLENSGSLVLTLGRPIAIVNGTRSNLAFGSTFPEAKDVFWDDATLARAWLGEDRVFLVTVINPAESVVHRLPQDRVHFLAQGGRATLYSNRP